MPVFVNEIVVTAEVGGRAAPAAGAGPRAAPAAAPPDRASLAEEIAAMVMARVERALDRLDER